MAAYRIVTGGLVLAAGETSAQAADLVLKDDCIKAIVPPGSFTSEAVERIDASGRLIIPGLINAHTHGHGGLAKGIGDQWSLELVLNAGPGSTARAPTRIAICRRCSPRWRWCARVAPPATTCRRCCRCRRLRGCTRSRGLIPMSGMRAVVSPMIADRSFYQAIPGLLDAFPPELRAVAETMRTAPGEATLAAIREAARSLAARARPHPPGHRADNSAALLRMSS